MAKKNRISVATIDSPEFVNITSMNNPLISKCEIKVLYVGENRNRSYITKEVATEMAQTLPGCPIVGYYIENKEDFGDHGDQIVIDGEGVKFNKLTKPYGFVAPDSKIWFKKFEDEDEFGNKTVREYLMTEGYLWTGQFEEAKRVIECGNPQSMELDEKTLKGYWSTDKNRGIDFFIINDAIFSKLCILGDDVEPCFEGANVTAPNISSSFSKDDDFTKSLYTMMNELKFALNNNEGGLSMKDETIVESTEVVEQPVVENFSNNEDKVVENVSAEIENTVEEFSKKEEDEEKKEEAPEKEETSETSENPDSEEKEESEEDKKKKVAENACHEDEKKEDEESKKKYQLLETELEELKTQFALLEEENKELKAFKSSVELKEKDELIKSFYMLDDEDKKDVIENKAQYSLDEIESKLSVICVRKKVNFNLDEEVENKDSALTTFNLDTAQVVTLPAWLQAVEDVKNNK